MLCAVHQTGGERERRSEALPVPHLQAESRVGAGEIVGWPELAAWIRRRGVILSGIALIVAQLIWKSLFLGHFYFWQDDFNFLQLGLGNSFSWKYLTLVEAGHLSPGAMAIAWAVARVSLYSWPLAAAVTVVMLAGAGLAALRVLLTVFGDRPAILVPLTVYLLSPLTLPGLRWWSAAIETLPLQIATFMALDAQVRYVRTGRFRHAVATAAWLLFGLVFSDKTLIVPLFLLGVTSGFLADGAWLATIRRCLLRYWRGWALQLLVLAGYLVVFVMSLRRSPVRAGIPGTFAGIVTFITKIVKNTFVPGAIGGPWQWFPTSDGQYAYSGAPATLAWLSLIVAVGVIGASIVLRRRAWRSWSILAGWLAAADITPVLLGNGNALQPGLLALETRYVADAVPVLAVCLGLAFWPVAGRSDAAGRRWAAGGGSLGRTIAAGVTAAVVVGSVWSAQALQNVTSSRPDRIFIASARVAVAEAPAGTVIDDEPVPQSLMLTAFGQDAYASRVVRPMESSASAANIRFTTQPEGTIDHLLVFGSDGRLHQAVVFGPASIPPDFGQQCYPTRRGRVVVRFPAPTAGGNEVLHIPYLASASVSGDAAITFGQRSYLLNAMAGLHDAYFPVRGSADRVVVSGPAVAGMCLGNLQVGLIVPSSSGPVIPPAG
jgi:hypothetical protein